MSPIRLVAAASGVLIAFEQLVGSRVVRDVEPGPAR